MTTSAKNVSLDFGFSRNFEPGGFVRHPDCPEWGIGQVQSAVGTRVTVNFEHAGKLLINTLHVTLEPVDPDLPSSRDD